MQWKCNRILIIITLVSSYNIVIILYNHVIIVITDIQIYSNNVVTGRTEVAMGQQIELVDHLATCDVIRENCDNIKETSQSDHATSPCIKLTNQIKTHPKSAERKNGSA